MVSKKTHAQGIKDLALSLLSLDCCCGTGSIPAWETSMLPWAWPKKEKEKAMHPLLSESSQSETTYCMIPRI